MNFGGTGIGPPDSFSYRSNFRSRFSFSFRSRSGSSSCSTTSGDIFYCSSSRRLNHSSLNCSSMYDCIVVVVVECEEHLLQCTTGAVLGMLAAIRWTLRLAANRRCFDTIHACDRRTDRQTEVAWHIRAIAYTLSHVKKEIYLAVATC